MLLSVRDDLGDDALSVSVAYLWPSKWMPTLRGIRGMPCAGRAQARSQPVVELVAN